MIGDCEVEVDKAVVFLGYGVWDKYFLIGFGREYVCSKKILFWEKHHRTAKLSRMILPSEVVKDLFDKYGFLKNRKEWKRKEHKNSISYELKG